GRAAAASAPAGAVGARRGRPGISGRRVAARSLLRSTTTLQLEPVSWSRPRFRQRIRALQDEVASKNRPRSKHGAERDCFKTFASRNGLKQSFEFQAKT